MEDINVVKGNGCYCRICLYTIEKGELSLGVEGRKEYLRVCTNCVKLAAQQLKENEQ